MPFLDTAAVLAGVLPGPLLSIASMLGYAVYRGTRQARTAKLGTQPTELVSTVEGRPRRHPSDG